MHLRISIVTNSLLLKWILQPIQHRRCDYLWKHLHSSMMRHVSEGDATITMLAVELPSKSTLTSVTRSPPRSTMTRRQAAQLFACIGFLYVHCMLGYKSSL